MIVEQWVYKEHRVILDLVGGNYHSAIYPPGSLDELSYSPIIEMKHGEQAAKATAEKFIDERLERKNVAP
jgi:hypothetical protein